MKKYSSWNLCFGVMATILIYFFVAFPSSNVLPNPVDCQVASEIPEPLSSLLLAAGGLLILRRKRRNMK